MLPFNPTITNDGLALFPKPALPGFQVELTHVGIGSGKYDPTGEETALQSEVARFPVEAGSAPSPTSVQVGITITDQDPSGNSTIDKWIGEIGFYSGSTLFAVWSRADKFLLFKSESVPVPLAYTLDVSQLPAGSVTVVVDIASPSMQAMIFAHEAAADPHPQYMTPEESGDMLAAHEAASDPHPQYLTTTKADARYAQLGNLSTADVLKALLGARARRFFHAAGM